MDIEESGFLPNRKSGQSKSLQRLTLKSNLQKISAEKPKKKEKSLKKRIKSHKFLKNTKFDTPEKNSSPMPHREIIKAPIQEILPLIENDAKTPFPSNISLVPKNQIFNLIKNGQPKTNNHINPLLLTPILINRKQENKNSKNQLAESLSPIEKFKKIKKIMKKPEKKIEINEKNIEKSENFYDMGEKKLENSEKNLENVIRPEEMKSFFYSKFTQPSFGDEEMMQEEEPVFLSERISYECESNQSLGIKFDAEKSEKPFYLTTKNESGDFEESVQSSCYREIEKNDNQTQTEEKEVINLLKNLDDNEVKLGIKFISKLAMFIKSIN